MSGSHPENKAIIIIDAIPWARSRDTEAEHIVVMLKVRISTNIIPCDRVCILPWLPAGGDTKGLGSIVEIDHRELG